MNKIIEKIIKERQTVKSYSDQKINDKDWRQILEMIYWSPSSHGFEPYRVLVINKNHQLRNVLKPLMWNQGVVTEADKLIFFISKNRAAFTDHRWLFKRALRRAKVILGKDDQEAKEMAQKQVDMIGKFHFPDEMGDEWPMKQAYIALGNALTGAAILGIGSTPIEGLQKAQIEALFQKQQLMAQDERIAVSAAFGYPASKTAYAHFGSGKRVRDQWDQKFQEI